MQWIKKLIFLVVLSVIVVIVFWGPAIMRYGFAVNADMHVRDIPVISDIYRDPRLEWVMNDLAQRLRARQFDVLEQYFTYQYRQGGRTVHGTDYLNAFEEITFRRQDALSLENKDAIDAWVKAYPQSPYALLTRASYNYARAWQIRGKKFVYQVPSERWPLFGTYLAAAYSDVKQAETLAPPVVYAYTLEIKIVLQTKGHGALDEAREILRRSKAATGIDDFNAYYAFLFYGYSTRWGGDTRKELAQARQFAANAPKGSLLPLLIVWAQGDLCNDMKYKEMLDYVKQPEVWNEVSGIYKRVIADYPRSALWMTGYAHAAYMASKGDISAAYLNKIYDLDPYYSKLYLSAGIAYAPDDYAMAESNFRQYIRFRPDDETPYTYLTEIALKKHDYAQVIRYADTGIALNPMRCDLWKDRCMANLRLNRLQQALNDCNRAIENDKYCPWAYQNRSEVYKAMGNPVASLKDYMTYSFLNKP